MRAFLTYAAPGTVTSKDGTVVGYRSVGRGPGLLVVQGAMGTIHNYGELALALADDFTVIVADRRGRGLTPLPFTPEAAAIQRDVPRGDIARLYGEIARDDLPAAMVTAMSIVKLLPWFVGLVPRPLRERGALRLLRDQDQKGTAPYASFRELLPSMRFDFRVVEERGDALASYQDVQTSILLLGGTRSPAYLKAALDALEKTLPHVRRETLRGLHHSGPWNRDRGGAPAVVAEQIRSFLGS